MSDDINRILIGSVVRKTIADAQNSPGRSVRNLVDAGVNFAKGSFQKRFLGDVQTILQNEDSAYYDLAKDILSNVDRHILFTLGMNLGYNGCTKGVKTIRETEKKADEIVRSAEEESRKIIEEAGQKAGILKDEILSKARENALKVAEDAEKKAEEAGKEDTRALDDEIRQLKAAALEREEEAVGLVISQAV